MGQGVVVLSGLLIPLCLTDSFALPPVEGSSAQSSVERRPALKNPQDRLASGEELLAHYARTGNRATLNEALTLLLEVSPLFSPEAIKARQTKAEEFDGKDVIAFARFSNLMFRYTGRSALSQQAQDSLSFMREEQNHLTAEAKRSFRQAQEELRTSPLHITVVGAKDDERAQRLWKEAVRVNDHYVRREWWDRREGALLNPDVRYPELTSPAAFVCVDRRCSLPLFTDQELRERLAQREITK